MYQPLSRVAGYNSAKGKVSRTDNAETAQLFERLPSSSWAIPKVPHHLVSQANCTRLLKELNESNSVKKPSTTLSCGSAGLCCSFAGERGSVCRDRGSRMLGISDGSVLGT